MEKWKKVVWSGESQFLLHHVNDWVIVNLGKRQHQDAGQKRQCDALGNAPLNDTFGLGFYVDVYLTPSTDLNIVHLLMTLCSSMAVTSSDG